jgi:hypothetical protein
LTGAEEIQPAFTKTLATPAQEPTRGTPFAEGIARPYEQIEWKGKAIEHYVTFLDLWKRADPGFPEIGEARESLKALR